MIPLTPNELRDIELAAADLAAAEAFCEAHPGRGLQWLSGARWHLAALLQHEDGRHRCGPYVVTLAGYGRSYPGITVELVGAAAAAV